MHCNNKGPCIPSVYEKDYASKNAHTYTPFSHRHGADSVAVTAPAIWAFWTFRPKIRRFWTDFFTWYKNYSGCDILYSLLCIVKRPQLKTHPWFQCWKSNGSHSELLKSAGWLARWHQGFPGILIETGSRTGANLVERGHREATGEFIRACWICNHAHQWFYKFKTLEIQKTHAYVVNKSHLQTKTNNVLFKDTLTLSVLLSPLVATEGVHL